MLSVSLLVAVMAAFLAGVAGGFAGLGISVVLVPLLLLVYDQPTVVALNGVLSAAIAAAVARDSWREADRPLVIALLALALPGLAVGAEALRVLDPTYLQLAVGVMVVLSAALLLRDDIRLPGLGKRGAPPIVGLASGALASSTGLSGPPAALLLASRNMPKGAFRASIALFFFGLDLALLAVLGLWGHLALSLAPLALLLVLATLVGKAVGTALFRRVSQKAFRTVVLGTIVLAGVMGVATAARALLH
jgi:uncharacterized membrane protein YfcA